MKVYRVQEIDDLYHIIKPYSAHDYSFKFCVFIYDLLTPYAVMPVQVKPCKAL